MYSFYRHWELWNVIAELKSKHIWYVTVCCVWVDMLSELYVCMYVGLCGWLYTVYTSTLLAMFTREQRTKETKKKKWELHNGKLEKDGGTQWETGDNGKQKNSGYKQYNVNHETVGRNIVIQSKRVMWELKNRYQKSNWEQKNNGKQENNGKQNNGK